MLPVGHDRRCTRPSRAQLSSKLWQTHFPRLLSWKRYLLRTKRAPAIIALHARAVQLAPAALSLGSSLVRSQGGRTLEMEKHVQRHSIIKAPFQPPGLWGWVTYVFARGLRKESELR